MASCQGSGKPYFRHQLRTDIRNSLGIVAALEVCVSQVEVNPL
jgi:hypothetical protein